MLHPDNAGPIFIGGLMKSGTSLLRKLLSLHPNIFGGLETHWNSDDFVNHWKEGDVQRHQWLLEFFEVSTSEANQIRSSCSSAYEYFDAFMNYCTIRASKKRWVEKTPDNVFNMGVILKLWPNAKILIMKRDFRDIYASWKKNKKRTFDIFLDSAKKFEVVLENYSHYHDRIRVVRYQDLVVTPKETLKDVLSFIGEEYISGLEVYRGDTSDYNNVLNVTGKISPTAVSLQKPIFTSSIDQWKEILDKEEIEVISSILP